MYNAIELLNSSLPLDELLKEIADLSAKAFAGGVRRSANLYFDHH